jgi:hypothetical protein
MSKMLMAGVPRLNPDLSVSVTAEDGQVVHTLPSRALTRGGIGYLYERLVGLRYEQSGYAVEYRSHLGYLDAGVDLIARNETECRFVQCKFTLRPLSRAKVETLLFAASKFVRSSLGPHENHLDLVVLSEALAFPIRLTKNRASQTGNPARRAFLSHNATQHQVRLNIVEVPMEIPESFVVDTSAHPG